MEEGAVTKVLHDFLTACEGEISVKKGDIVQASSKYNTSTLLTRLCKNESTGHVNFIISVVRV
jgi:hypothetical protein